MESCFNCFLNFTETEIRTNVNHVSKAIFTTRLCSPISIETRCHLCTRAQFISPRGKSSLLAILSQHRTPRKTNEQVNFQAIFRLGEFGAQSDCNRVCAENLKNQPKRNEVQNEGIFVKVENSSILVKLISFY